VRCVAGGGFGGDAARCRSGKFLAETARRARPDEQQVQLMYEELAVA